MTGVGKGKIKLFLNSAKDGSFEAREGKIKEVIGFGVRKMVFIGVTIFGGLRNGGATGVGKTEDFGDLIKTFADGIVAGGADDFEGVVGGHVKDLGVAAGDD